MKYIMFIAPNGRQEEHEMTEIEGYDASFFEQQGVKISIEQLLTGDIVVYADTGKVDEDGEPDELIELALGRPCREVMTALRIACEQRFESDGEVHHHDTI